MLITYCGLLVLYNVYHIVRVRKIICYLILYSLLYGIFFTDVELSTDEVVNPQAIADSRTYIQSMLSSHIEIIHDAKSFGSISEFAKFFIELDNTTESILICNLATVTSQFELRQSELPMVEPFYAVKCNPDLSILRILASLGCGFDCASMSEIDLILNGLGDELNFAGSPKASNKIAYSNPAKMANIIEYAINNGIEISVFDDEDELYKIASMKNGHKMKLLLR